MVELEVSLGVRGRRLAAAEDPPEARLTRAREGDLRVRKGLTAERDDAARRAAAREPNRPVRRGLTAKRDAAARRAAGRELDLDGAARVLHVGLLAAIRVVGVLRGDLDLARGDALNLEVAVGVARDVLGGIESRERAPSPPAAETSSRPPAAVARLVRDVRVRDGPPRARIRDVSLAGGA